MSLNILETFGPVQVCNGIALTLTITVAVLPAAGLHYKLPDIPKWVVLITGL
jgi:hypothetical protein